MEVKFHNGSARIDMDTFFPARVRRLKILLCMVSEDLAHREALLQEMYEYCLQQAKDFTAPEELKRLANATVDAGTKAAELKPRIDALRLRAGLWRKDKALEEKLKSLELRQKLLTRDKVSCEREFIRRKRRAEEYAKNAEAIWKKLQE